MAPVGSLESDLADGGARNLQTREMTMANDPQGVAKENDNRRFRRGQFTGARSGVSVVCGPVHPSADQVNRRPRTN